MLDSRRDSKNSIKRDNDYNNLCNKSTNLGSDRE